MTDTLFFIDEDEVLAHHGVKGMKWGVRKQRAASGGAGSTKKRKGFSRKQKAAIAGVLGTAAAAGAGYYLHKSGKGKQLAGLAKKGGASAKKYAQGKGRNLGAQARVKTAQAFGKDAKNFAGAQAALGKLMVGDTKRRAKTAASKLKYSKAGKYAEATRLAANAAAFKTGHTARSAGFRAKQGAWKVGNKARRAATGGVSGAKSAAGMAARSAKSKAGAAASAARAAAGSAKSKVGAAAKSTASVKTPGKALQVAPRGVGYRKLYTTGTKVKAGKGVGADKLAKRAALGLGVGIGANAAAAAAGAAINRKAAGGKKGGRSRKRRR
nr:MAG TPA: hypothetical protein [Siphovirus LN-2020-1]